MNQASLGSAAQPVLDPPNSQGIMQDFIKFFTFITTYNIRGSQLSSLILAASKLNKIILIHLMILFKES